VFGGETWKTAPALTGEEDGVIGLTQSDKKWVRTFQVCYVNRYPPYDQWEACRLNALLPSIKTSLPNAGIGILKPYGRRSWQARWPLGVVLV
jgi:hypothetical protein